jgi:hypothetical protein
VCKKLLLDIFVDNFTCKSVIADTMRFSVQQLTALKVKRFANDARLHTIYSSALYP